MATASDDTKNRSNSTHSGTGSGESTPPLLGSFPDIIPILNLLWSCMHLGAELLLKFIQRLFGIHFPVLCGATFSEFSITEDSGQISRRKLGLISVETVEGEDRYILDVTYQLTDADKMRLCSAFLDQEHSGSANSDISLVIIDLSREDNCTLAVPLSDSDSAGGEMEIRVFGFRSLMNPSPGSSLFPLVILRLLKLFEIIDPDNIRLCLDQAVSLAESVMADIHAVSNFLVSDNFRSLRSASQIILDAALLPCRGREDSAKLRRGLRKALTTPLDNLVKGPSVFDDRVTDSRTMVDAALKDFLDHPEIYAEVVNGVLYGGKQAVDPLNLLQAPTQSTGFPGGGLRSQIRDNDMFLKNGKDIVLELGIEGLTYVEPDLPMKVAAYNSSSYSRQLLIKMKRYGIITLVLYFGNAPYSSSLSLKGQLNPSLRSAPENSADFLDDCNVHLLDVKHLNSSAIQARFPGDFGIICQILTGNYGGQMQQLVSALKFKVEALTLLFALTSNPVFKNHAITLAKYPEKGGEITMLSINEAERKIGFSLGVSSSMFRLYNKRTISADTAASEVGVSVPDFKKAYKVWLANGRKMDGVEDTSHP